jgi:rubrerythrin
VERGGAAFYQTLADKTADERGQRLFEKLSRDELTHATALEQHPAAAGQTHASLELPDQTLRDLEGGEEELARVAALPIEQAFNAALYVERC